MDLLFSLSSELYPNTSGIPLSICGKIRCLPVKKASVYQVTEKSRLPEQAVFPSHSYPLFLHRYASFNRYRHRIPSAYLPSFKQNTTQKGAVHTDDGKQPNRQLRSLPCRELPMAANRINGAADSAPKIKYTNQACWKRTSFLL